MNPTLTLLTALLLFPSVSVRAQSSPKDAAGSGYAVGSRLEELLGEPLFVPLQQLWENRGGWGGVLTAKDGTVVTFQSPGGGNCRRSRDGGKTWDADIEIAPDATGGRALVDETKGDILYVNPAAGWLFRSRDSARPGCARERAGAARRVREHPEDRGRGGHAVRHHTLLQQRGHRRRRLMPKQVGASIATGPRESHRLGRLRRRPHLAGQAARLRRPRATPISAWAGTGRQAQGKIYLPFRRRSERVPRSGASGLVQPELAALRSRHHQADRENTLVANNRTKHMKAVFFGILLSSLVPLAAEIWDAELDRGPNRLLLKICNAGPVKRDAGERDTVKYLETLSEGPARN